MNVIVGTSPMGQLQKFSSEKVLGSPVSPKAARGPDHFLQKTFDAANSSNSVEDLEWEKLSIEELLTMATTMSLMGDTRTFRITGALNGTRADEFLDIAKDLAQSPHQFIFTEEKLLKRPTDMVTRAGALVVVHPAAKKEEAFNMFSVTFAFAARDRKKLWLLLLQAGRAGVVPEATLGMLHWKVRDMLGKGEKGKYTKKELVQISRQLVTLYHDSHRGAGDLSLLLERFVLLI